MHLTVLGIAGVAGIALGLRFKVLVVLPATLVAALSVATLDFTVGTSGPSRALLAALAVIALQFGYVIGAALAHRWHSFSTIP
jgi:hypothetical protein